MRTVYLKHTEASQGQFLLDREGPLGPGNGLFRYRIDNVPEDQSDTEVIQQATGTTFLFRDREDNPRKFTADFDELKVGIILDHPVRVVE